MSILDKIWHQTREEINLSLDKKIYEQICRQTNIVTDNYIYGSICDQIESDLFLVNDITKDSISQNA